MLPGERHSSGDRIAEIDGLRAVAMTMVIAQHCGLAPFGWTGVWLFFVISGYVISRNFMRREYVAESWARAYRMFMRRRFFRIVPVYVLYVAMGSILLVGSRDGALRDVPFLLTFTFNWQVICSLWPNPDRWAAFEHLWTLSVEEQFYLVYPLLFLLLRRRRYLAALIVLVAAGPLVRYVYSGVLAAVSSDAQWKDFAIYAASFAHFDAFLLGALIANCESELRKRDWLAGLVGCAALVAIVAYAVTYMLVNRANGAAGIDVLQNVFSGLVIGQGREVLVYSVVNLAAGAALICAILQKPFVRVLARPAVSLVGRISYGGYLYHALVLWLISSLAAAPAGLPLTQRVGWFVVAWSLTVAAAYASYRWFEMPIIAWSKTGRGDALAESGARQPA